MTEASARIELLECVCYTMMEYLEDWRDAVRVEEKKHHNPLDPLFSRQLTRVIEEAQRALGLEGVFE